MKSKNQNLRNAAKRSVANEMREIRDKLRKKGDGVVRLWDMVQAEYRLMDPGQQTPERCRWILWDGLQQLARQLAAEPDPKAPRDFELVLEPEFQGVLNEQWNIMRDKEEYAVATDKLEDEEIDLISARLEKEGAAKMLQARALRSYKEHRHNGKGKQPQDQDRPSA